ncbi:hypothetical protein PMG11_10145 [Penicillium brasilianum]|uniref:Ankyrin repeat protein n=1 Tax=Penicillium brasilianum TaxID=104259 RepID=A0A0F7U1W0_PENBI|nr:hypothetical protein PMG11_10145 [Penicillium brasilianum]
MNLIEGSDGNGFMLCKTRLEAARSLLRTQEEKQKTWQPSPNRAQAVHTSILIARRQYSMLEEMIPRIDVLVLNSINVSLLHKLVEVGLSVILDRVCTREAALKFYDHEWCRQAEDANHCSRNMTKPLLITACERRLPNMEVVCFLVEKMGVDININARKKGYTSGKDGLLSGNGVLHDLAGGVTWWNVHQVSPYLIGKGANLELRNHDGDTSLHIALEFRKYKGVFYKDAVKILLDNGADVNALNSKGETCLSKTGSDIELITLLLSYGTEISPAAIFSAIELGNVELLEFFLSQGDLANLRRPAPETPERIEFRQIPRAEVYPLLHAATFESSGKPGLNPFRMRMMTALLQHGADPHANFTKFYQVNDDPFCNEKKLDSVIQNSRGKWEAKTCIVIHEILETGKIVEPLLQLPSLQLELRDSQGRTLILSTTEGKTIQELADRGADITAQEKSGATVVHNLIQREPHELVINTIKALLTRDPNLVHISDNAEYVDLLLAYGADPLQLDSKGNTALHFLATNPHVHKARIQQLLELGLDLNARNKKGYTPLSRYYAHSSLRYGNSFWGNDVTARSDNDFMVFFKDRGADFFALNNMGTSLVHVVAGREISDGVLYLEERLKEPMKNHVRWFKFLMDMGLDPMLEDAQQRTSLDVAAACGNEHILKLFNQRPTESI